MLVYPPHAAGKLIRLPRQAPNPFRGDAAGSFYWTSVQANNGAANNDPINTLTDLLYGGTISAAAAGPTRATWLTNIINGRPTLRFDGSDDNYVFATPPLLAGNNPFSTYILCNCFNPVGNRTPMHVGGVGPDWMFPKFSGDNLTLEGGSPVVDTLTGAAGEFRTNKEILIALRYGAGTIEVNVTGSGLNRSQSYAKTVSMDNTRASNIGCLDQVFDYFSGNISAVVILRKKDSAVEYAAREAYLRGLYGV